MNSGTDDAPTQALDPLFLRAQLRVGTTLRRKWRLDVLLGIGGMATVYAATHRNGSRAAVKILHPELSLHSQLRSRFLREGYLANSVGHDGAVKVIDDDVAEDGSLFLVTELLDGETLEDRRVRFGGSLSEQEVLLIADQLLDVLAAAHSRGIVHRDLKPENVFLTRTGQVKVLDFGIARLRELTTSSTATKSGVMLGTPAYMSPEQARGLWDEVESRSDIWACGATIFHLLSGRHVHEGRTPNEQLLNAMTKGAAPCSSVTPRVGPALASIVDTALAFDREERWPDARSMQKAVRNAYSKSHGRPIATAAPLVVPAHVVDRTLPSAQSPQESETHRPVESARRESIPSPHSPITMGVAIVGAAVLGASLTGLAWTVSSARLARGIRQTAAASGAAAFVGSAESLSGTAAALRPIVEEAPSAAPSETAWFDAGAMTSAPSVTLNPVAAPTLIPRPQPTASATSPSPAKATSPRLPTGYKDDVPY